MVSRRGTATDPSAPGAIPASVTRSRAVDGELKRPLVSSSEVIRSRLRDTEDLLAKGTNPRRARYALAELWGIRSKEAARYVHAVHRLWAVDAGADPEQARTKLRAQLDGVLRKVIDVGFERERGLVDTTGTEHTFPDPDLRSVLGAVDALARFGGITEPITVDARSVHLHGTSDAETLKRIRSAYFGPDTSEISTLPAVIDTKDEV